MPTSRYQDKVLETYARSLLEAAKAENHVFEDLEMIERLASASPEIIAVLDTMSKRDQLDLLPKVAAAFKYVAEEDEDVVGVTVTTAIPLDDELRQTITKKCEQDFGRKVFLIEQVDPSIVGGLVLEARGKRRDISVKTQLRIAETEKYAHVTFFLNGGIEEPKEGEERVLVASPKVATYDLQPEMSAPEVTEKLVAAINEDRADFYIVNFANCDMVGHTGVFDAAVKAVEAVDDALSKVVPAILAKGGFALITADHGNADHMFDVASDGSKHPFTAHTTNRVPFIIVDEKAKLTGIEDGRLSDIAPTMLTMAGIEPSAEMTGRVLATEA